MNRSVDSPPPDLLRLFEPIRADLQRVEDEYAEHLQSQRRRSSPASAATSREPAASACGPAVLLMASRLCGYAGERADPPCGRRRVHPHRDAGPRRHHRRLPKCAAAVWPAHSQWGNDITVLLGDFLYIKSMSLALTENSLEMVRLLCDVTLRMIEGELYQLTKNGDIDDHRGRALRHHPPQDGVPVCRLRRRSGACSATSTPEQQGGAARVRVQSRHRVPADGRPARLHRRRRRRSASRWAATCARAR